MSQYKKINVNPVEILDGRSEIPVKLSAKNKVGCGENTTIYAKYIVTLNIKLPSEL